MGVGEHLGEGVTQEQAVVGETPNLAARLQSLAEPDTVFIDNNTHRLLGELPRFQIPRPVSSGTLSQYGPVCALRVKIDMSLGRRELALVRL
jgi:class 3 adenylate cyclase